MFYLNPLKALDFYKTDHRRQYPKNTTEVYSNFTPRSNKYAPKLDEYWPGGVVVFGMQYFLIDFLLDYFNKHFFEMDAEEVVGNYRRTLDTSLGLNAVPVDHMYALHKLGYLPLEIKALPEGSICPIGVPMYTFRNTHPDFAWLTNHLETIASVYLWPTSTAATTALQYRLLLTDYAKRTGFSEEAVAFQAHDFSFRGMPSLSTACATGMAHLLSFVGTDTVPAIAAAEYFYGINPEEELIGTSVPATEHSVMCMGGQEDELETFKRLITELYPSGFVSIVSDTWDFWRVITEFMPALHELIMARDGRVVIRPDSGDPVKIICGDVDAPVDSPEYKGAVQCLWEIFGGTTTSTGHRLLDSHIGLIYGEKISLRVASEILHRLELNGFCSGNVVFGVGSFTYQYVTRDSYGFAIKATHGVVNSLCVPISKDPKTDDGTKKSAKGYLRVDFDDEGKITLYEDQTWEEEQEGFLQTVFLNSQLVNRQTFTEVRARLLHASSK